MLGSATGKGVHLPSLKPSPSDSQSTNCTEHCTKRSVTPEDVFFKSLLPWILIFLTTDQLAVCIPMVHSDKFKARSDRLHGSCRSRFFPSYSMLGPARSELLVGVVVSEAGSMPVTGAFV